MEQATLFLAVISALAAGASAIAAWAAGQDSKRAAKRAESAQDAALSAWKDAASALAEANALAAEHFEESVKRDRRLRRVSAANPLRRAYVDLAINHAKRRSETSEESERRKTLVDQLAATGEPQAYSLTTRLRDLVEPVKPGDGVSAIIAATEIIKATDRWVESPETFEQELGDEHLEKVSKSLEDLLNGFIQSASANEPEDPTGSGSAM